MFETKHNDCIVVDFKEVGVSIKPRLLSICDSATYAATSRSTLYVEEKAGRIKFLKMGSSTRIEVSELDRWINEKTKSA
jgi:excisionase family DNA binding protein